jgi:choline dehydrogenase-like flavoprotein
MIRDFRTFDAQNEIECDLCIAGTGAAGITLARAFAGRHERVVVLESGGLERDEEIQELYDGSVAGLPYPALDIARVRALGGSTNHWGGMCAILDERDFAARPWVPMSGWPIGRSAIAPYYPEAHEVLDLGPFEHDPHRIPPPGGALLPFDERLVSPRLFRYSNMPQRFGAGASRLGTKYRRRLELADNIHLWLHANLTEIELAVPEGGVAAFRVQSLDGRSTRVRARAYVLALGGLENPRLLLASNRVVPNGVGNGRDLVGRYFMEHPGASIGEALWSGEGLKRSYQVFESDGIPIHQALAPGDGLVHEAQILNMVAAFGRIHQARASSEGYTALHDVKRDLAAGRLPNDFGRHLWSILTDLGGVVRGFRERFDSTTHILIEVEQAPNPDSRLRLGDERDRLGLPRPVLDWRLSELDKRTVRVFAQALAREFGRVGAGRIQLKEWVTSEDDHDWGGDLVPSYHHIGTTRMAASPAHGVVDRNCRVFGCDNLFIAGSSVFATAGFANPTLNIVALTLRLADHLKIVLEDEAPVSLRPVEEGGV